MDNFIFTIKDELNQTKLLEVALNENIAINYEINSMSELLNISNNNILDLILKPIGNFINTTEFNFFNVFLYNGAIEICNIKINKQSFRNYYLNIDKEERESVSFGNFKNKD